MPDQRLVQGPMQWSEAMNVRTIRQNARVFKFCIVLFVVLVPSSGCSYFLLLRGDCSASLSIHGRFVDSVTLEPASDVVFGVRTFLAGELLGGEPALRGNGSPNHPLPDEDGNFTAQGASFVAPCPARAVFPMPDLVILTILRGNCTEEITIEFTAESAIYDENDSDDDASTDIYTLTEPVLVSPCGE